MSINMNNKRNNTTITSEEIISILRRYNIGKKPLARLLGWGETTILRYIEGDIPTCEYSKKLRAILEDPEYYYEILEHNQDLITGVAYRKSREAVLGTILSSKINEVSYYIMNMSKWGISSKYLQSILYYSQVFSLVLYNKELFPDDCMVNDEYIPYEKQYKRMERNGSYIIHCNYITLSPAEKALIEEVYEAFSWYGPRALHEMAICDKTGMKISRDQSNKRIVTKDNLKEYFKEVLKRYKITSINEIKRYPRLRLKEISERNK